MDNKRKCDKRYCIVAFGCLNSNRTIPDLSLFVLPKYPERYPPDGLLTLEDAKHDVELNPLIIAPDPFASDDCLDAFPPIYLLTSTEELKMGEDEPSGVNGRLRPRKSTSFSAQAKAKSKPEPRIVLNKPKRTGTPSKASPNKKEDSANQSDFTPPPYFLCSYCDKKFATRQTVSKHARRMHFSSSKQDAFLGCLFCNHTEADSNIIRHMVDSHPNQYFACLDCHARFSSTSELAEHKLNVCEKQKVSYRTKLRQKVSFNAKKSKKSLKIDGKDDFRKDDKDFQDGHGFNGIVISCELKPSQVHDEADIEDNITTNLILPPSKSLGSSGSLEKNAIIVLDDIQQWNKRIPSNFSFHNTDTDQILSRLGVVQRSTRTGESTKKDWMKAIEESTQKFEKCFDTKFYSKVASNVQENLSKFLDGSFNFNPDPDSTIKTRKSKNSVVINTAEGFPILLACEQYSRSVFDSYLPRAIAPKHKWKWDSIDSDKIPDQIKRDSHANNCIITLVSSLDIWTQLCMRQKYDEKFNNSPLEKKTEKQNMLSKELKEILESREIPSMSEVMKYAKKAVPNTDAPDFPASLGLSRASTSYSAAPAVLSGEWVRPRSYVCCACGHQTADAKELSAHIGAHHPNAHVQSYEIVGEPLLNANILKYLYVPPSQVCNRTRPPRGFRECTKCKKSVTLEDLHQHMLDCAGDTPTVRRRQCRYRPFGVRRRRPRLPDNTIRKKMRKDAIRSQQRRQKTHMRPRPRKRTEVGDAETIRKMIADLPAKRHRAVANPGNMMQRPRKTLDRQRSKLIMKKSFNEDPNHRKRCIKGISSERKSKSVHNDEQNKNSSSMEEDDDNKPLKPKLKSAIGRITRQRESLKRQSITNRAKRKSMRVEQRKKLNKEESGPSVPFEEASVDSSPQRIDVQRGQGSAREQAGGERASGGRAPAGSRAPPAPPAPPAAPAPLAPTAPLKHSIARLTADSERHDKSVQFHRLFLVQQECNNTDRHVPAGRQTLFENEAVVTKLDKPPLNFCSKGQYEIQALQKNKLNKPRKGLNACIAMLKNKLVEPEPYEVAGHVSVQCGNDDPIETGFHPNIQTLISRNTEVDINIPLKTTHNKIIQIDTIENRGPDKPVLLPHNQEPDLPKDKNAEGLDKNKLISEHTTPVAKIECEVNDKKIISGSNKASNNTISVKLNESNFSDQSSSNATKPRSRHNSDQLTTNLRSNQNRERSIEIRSDNDELKKKTLPALATVTTTWQKSLDISKRSNVYPENIILRQHGLHAETELHPQVSLDAFTESQLIDIPDNIPPAHASTHVESIISTPLDLSSRMIDAGNAKTMSNPDSYIVGYDSYETLDLSNKHSSRAMLETAPVDDVVVDLRIKVPQSRSPPSTLDLCVKSTNRKSSTVSDTIIKTSTISNFPTDLSMKGKGPSMFDLSDKRIDKPFIQDLSGTKIIPKETDSIHLNKETVVTDIGENILKSCAITYVHELKEATKVLENKTIAEPKVITSKACDELSTIPNQKQNDVQIRPASNIDLQLNNVIESRNGSENSTSKSTLSRITDRSLPIPKPVYDPTLIIPQYKIRANAPTTEVSSVLLSDPQIVTSNSKATSICLKTTQNSNIQTISATNHDGLSYALESKSVNSVTGSIGTHAFQSYAVTLPSRIESTKPVYTLANACISVTKIESSSSITLTNTLLSIPGSTIASTAPVYTLTGTTIAVPSNYGTQDGEIHNGSSGSNNYASSLTQADHIYTADKEIADYTSNREVRGEVTKQNAPTVDQDPETARKIAMLPKELVDILGNMPVDHRNQLLNVLPQYVSSTVASSPSPTLDCAHAVTEFNKSMPNKPSSTAVNNLTEVSEPQVECQSSILPLSTTLQATNKTLLAAALPAEPAFIDKKQFNVAPTTLLAPAEVSLNANATPSNSLQCSKDTLGNKVTNTNCLDPSIGTIPNRVDVIDYVNPQHRVIDLTKEEMSVNVNYEKIDVPHSVAFPPQDLPGSGPLGNTNKQKSNNDKTASLRAVRIKAPSERQKESQMLKRVSVEHTQNVTETDENEVNKNKISDSHKSLAIQQAEVSSTQHTNKNVGTDSKYSVEVLSTDIEPCMKSRRISTPTADIIIEKENSSVNVIESPTTKSSLVTSSIPINKVKENLINERLEITDNGTQQNSSKDNSDESFDNLSVEVQSIKSPAVVLIANIIPKEAEILPTKTEMLAAELEEDSEDDISLATIVKQKQHSSLKSKNNALEETPLANLDLSLVKKKKKEGKSRKVMGTNRILKKFNNDEITEKDINIQKDLENSLKNRTKRIPRKKLKEGNLEVKNKKSIQKEPVVCINKDKNVFENSLKPQCDDHLAVSSKSQSHQKDLRKTVEAQHNVLDTANEKSIKNKEEEIEQAISAGDSCEKSQENATVQLEETSKSNKNVKIKEKFKTKKKLVEIEEEKSKINVNEITNAKPESFVSTEVTFGYEALCIKSSENTSNDVEKPEEICGKNHEISTQREPEVIKNKAESTKKSPFIESATLKDVAKHVFLPDLPICNDVEEKTGAPLRRSRRGKSLFTESAISEQDLLSTEVVADPKAPLTKKQLIFSKLLLDEEQYSKKNSPEKEMSTTKNDDILKIIDVTSNDLVPDINNECTSKTSSEKCMPIKRKKSQSKRKFKKQKSVETLECVDRTEDSLYKSKDDLEVCLEENNATSYADIKVKQHLEFTDNSVPDKEETDKNIHETSNTCKSIKNDIISENDQDIINQNQSPSSEKRKSSNATNEEYSQGSKPKKTKFDISKKNQDEHSTISDTRVTTCYDVPVAARRTRSKSVVVKSTNDFYDPYDINLEDMVEKTEPLRKSECKTREIKTNLKRFNILEHKDLTEKKVSEDVDYLESNSRKKKDKKKLESPLGQSDIKINDYPTETNWDKKTNSSKVTDNVSDENIFINLSEKYAGDETAAGFIVRCDVSDSDESSKSDVPLKKYVDEKMKMSEISAEKETDNTGNVNKEQSKKPNNNKHEKNKQTVSTNEDKPSCSNVTDEQLRSEQFMESFGFFSERKPRKSNLLATKKISETFHIIASESDDVFFSTRERLTKKAENRKSTEEDSNVDVSNKKYSKRGRKKKSCTKTTICRCELCGKTFRRPDNYLRHQMTLLHVSKLAEIELKLKTEPLVEEPNYLITFKQHIDRLRMLSSKSGRRKKKSKSKIVLPTIEEILADVNKTVREQQVSCRGLSRDEALFLDCCELLKESHKTDIPIPEASGITTNLNSLERPAHPSTTDLDFINKNFEKFDNRSDGDVDSITAKSIMESEEVRNLENDLISGLKEAANVNTSKNMNYNRNIVMDPHEITSEKISILSLTAAHEQMEINDIYSDVPMELDTSKSKKNPEFKEKMYPDIEDIDMFEDKFDKIKRKCRSQAAAAKQAQTAVKSVSGHKDRKKSNKKKGKKSSKRNYQNTVLTKGALKGFDGIKVSIPTSDINMSAIVTSENALKKRKKTVSKRKREKRDSETSSKYDSDNRFKDSSTGQNKVDVYEFMDNEDAELFEFRPSTLMERFKSISNKEAPSTSKYDSVADENDNSSGSASDGDDFVYMSDDYVCSDDDTENSLLSCELGQVKTDKIDIRKPTPPKRKDIIEKNAVMGKIFKHNAVRAEKKIIKIKDTAKPKANLDQLFDSLLEEEPSSSMLNNDSSSHEREDFDVLNKKDTITLNRDELKLCESFSLTKGDDKSKKNQMSTSPNTVKTKIPLKKFDQDSKLSPTNYDFSQKYEYCPSTSKKDISLVDIYGPSTSKQYGMEIPKYCKAPSPKKHDQPAHKKCDVSSKYLNSPPLVETSDLNEKIAKDKLPLKKLEEPFDCNTEFDEDTGVASQRARRKCTIGKQNVLAETWSSESEPDSVPPRSNSAESVVAGPGRKKKGKKRESQQSFVRRKKQDVESRVNSSNRSISSSGANIGVSRPASGGNERSGIESLGAASPSEMCPPPATSTAVSQGTVVAGVGAGTVASCSSQGPKMRPRAAAYYWSSEGDDEQEHLQQHGWIVGDSHKKLVTMLAHAKGRKRNNDDKRNFVE